MGFLYSWMSIILFHQLSEQPRGETIANSYSSKIVSIIIIQQ
jgi:hypothetical protein